MVLNIGGEPDPEMVRKLTDSSFIPVTVGGGIESVDAAISLLRSGADKVCVKSKTAISAISSRLGSQAVCACLELVDGMDAVREAVELEHLGAGEILFQSVERDGMMGGYDLKTLKDVSEAVSIPVIASCGCGSYEHMVEAINAGASAVAAGAFFQFTEHTPKGAAEYLNERGVTARI